MVSRQQLLQGWNGINWDKKLTNLYGCGWLNGACLPAYKLMHLTMIRHGSVFQVIDPWPTSWYMYWVITMPRDIVLGDTVGEAYRKGVSHVGVLYATDPPQWWWDSEQNMVYFGDPDLRLFTPGTEYSDANYWEKEDTESLRYNEDTSINGHMPYGATDYPHEKTPDFWQQYLWTVATALIIAIMVGIILFSSRRKRRRKEK